MLIQQAVGMRPSEMRACRGLCKREALRLSIRLGKKNGVFGNNDFELAANTRFSWARGRFQLVENAHRQTPRNPCYRQCQLWPSRIRLKAELVVDGRYKPLSRSEIASRGFY
jgi:hypothetical protein